MGRPVVLVATNEGAREAGVKAGALVRVAAGVLGGGGGGKDDVAQGGGQDQSEDWCCTGRCPRRYRTGSGLNMAEFQRGVRMGVDVGNARVGTALSDPDGILATPLKTLRRDAKKNSDRRVLRKLIEVNEVVEVFVGLPKTMRGGDSPSTEMAREYAQALRSELDAEEKTHINIWLWMSDSPP